MNGVPGVGPACKKLHKYYHSLQVVQLFTGLLRSGLPACNHEVSVTSAHSALSGLLPCAKLLTPTSHAYRAADTINKVLAYLAFILHTRTPADEPSCGESLN